MIEPHEYCNVDLKQFTGHKDEVNCVAFSPDYEMMVTGSDDRCVRVFNARTAQLVVRLRGHSAAVRCVAVSDDSKYFASGAYDKTARLYRTRDAECLYILEDHEKSVESMVFSHDGRYLVTGSWDKTARLWRVGDGSLLAIMRGHTNLIQSVAITADNDFLATGSWDYTVRVWSLPDFPDLPDDVTSDNQSPLPILDDVISPVQSETRERSDVIASDPSPTDDLDTINEETESSDESTENSSDSQNDDVTNDNDDDVIIEENEVENTEIAKITNVSEENHKFSPESESRMSKMSSRDASKTERLNDDVILDDVIVVEDMPFTELKGHTGNVYAVAFSRAGMLASGSWDKTVRLWAPKDGRLLHVLRGHTGWIRGVCFTLDSFYAASVGDDEEVIVWDVVTGECCRRLQAASDTVHLCGFSEGGALVASGANNTTIGFT